MIFIDFMMTFEGASVICLIIVLWGGIAAYTFNRRIDPLLADFRAELNTLLSTAKDEEQFADYFSELDDSFRKSHLLKHSWREFTEILIFPITQDDEIKVLNATPPGSFFNRHTLLEPRINLRFYNAMPNLLTGAGILGTFLGLVFGIYQATDGLASQDITEVQNALQSLLGGASLAFMTSIAGLLSSIIFTWWEKRQIHRFDQLCNSWVEALDDRLKTITQEKLAKLTLHEVQQQRFALEQFGNNFAFQLASAFDTNVSAKLSPVLQAVLDELIGMRKEQQQASDETLERLLKEFSENMSDAAGKELKELGATLANLSTSLETNINNLAQNQKKMQENTESSIDNLTTAFTENSAKLSKTLEAGVQDMVTKLKSTVDDMADVLRSATEQSTANMRLIVDRFDDSVAKLRQSIAEIHSMTTNTHSINHEMTELLKAITQAEHKIDSLADIFSSSANEFAEASSILKVSASQLATSNTSIESAVEVIRNSQQEIIESWNDYCERFENVDKDLAQTLQTLQNGLNEYVESTNRYVVGLDEHASKITQNLASAARQLEESIESLIAELPTA